SGRPGRVRGRRCATSQVLRSGQPAAIQSRNSSTRHRTQPWERLGDELLRNLHVVVDISARVITIPITVATAQILTRPLPFPPHSGSAAGTQTATCPADTPVELEYAPGLERPYSGRSSTRVALGGVTGYPASQIIVTCNKEKGL